MNTVNPSAGVYVTERDLSQRVAAASTTIGAIVGPSGKGPVMERTLVTSTKQFLSLFGPPTPQTSFMHYCALQFLTESSRLYVTRVENGALTAGAYLSVDDLTAPRPVLKITNFDDGTNQPLGKYDPFNTLEFDPEAPGIERVLGFFCAANPGTWNNDLFVRVRPSNKPGVADPDNPLLFHVDVFLNYASRRQAPDETFLVCRDYYVDGFGEQLHIEEVINSKSNLIRYRGNPNAPLDVKILNTATEYLGGASNGDRPTEGQMVQAWELYRDPEQLDVNILIQGGYDSVAVQQTMTDIAEDRMDSVAILDLPRGVNQVADAIYFRRNDLNIDSSYAALYGPDLSVYDEYNDLQVYVPASGHAAAAYARTDNVAETWFAPAGLNRGMLRIQGVREVYNQGDRDALTDAQINCIRVIPGIGYAIWGADTLQVMPSALSNVNVRRLMNFLETSIKLAALYQVFEPGDEILWARLTEMCERFLKPIKAGRGMYWFGVQCDEQNNPPELQQLGDTALDIYVDPVIPAKRIHLNATVNRRGARFTSTVIDQQ